MMGKKYKITGKYVVNKSDILEVNREEIESDTSEESEEGEDETETSEEETTTQDEDEDEDEEEEEDSDEDALETAVNNRLPTTTSDESSGSRVSSACAIPTINYQQKPQHDHSDDRASIGSSCSSNSLENTNKNTSISRSVSSSPSYPFYQSSNKLGNQTTAVASSSPLSLSSLLFCDQNIDQTASYTPFVIQPQPITAGTYNSVLDLMGKGRNKNKYRGGPANSHGANNNNNNNNKNVMKNNNNNNVETTSNNVIKSNNNNNNNNNNKCFVEELSATNIPLQNVDVVEVKNNSENAQTLNEFDFSTKEQENCEKSLCEDAINKNTATAGTHSNVVEENENENVAVATMNENVENLQSKVNDLVYKVDGLERDLALRQWAVERLQSELEATNKEGECVRQKLKFQDAQLERVKEEQYVVSEEDGRKYLSLEQQHAETVMKLKKMQTLASTLNVQLAQASVDTEKIRQERDEILDRLQAEEKILRDVLETSIAERERIDAKWKHDFEQLRNVNCDREEHLMEDCEWKIRSMLKSAKEKVDKAEKERILIADQTQLDKKLIKEQRLEIKQLKSSETEAGQLRGLTNEQCETIKSMTSRVNELKTELEAINKRLQTEIDSCQQIKRDCSYQLSEKERETINRIEIARGEIAIEWEDRLMEEMCRLKLELEQCHLDDRNVALNELREEALIATQVLTTKFKEREQELVDEIQSLKSELVIKRDGLVEAQAIADTKLMEHRSFLERREREHQQEMDRHLREHSDTIDELKSEYKREKEEIKESFYKSLEQIKEEFANEITITTETLTVKHKKELEEQWKHLIHEKESALQTSETRHRIRIEDADNKLSAQMTNYQRQMDDMRGQYEHQQNRLQGRDVQNAQEIDQLHRKCICLTKLFEEMRMRYERRDPRPDDLRQIDELKNVVESQERDICDLTEQLRDLQLQQQQNIQTNNNSSSNNQQQSRRGKGRGKMNSNQKSQNNATQNNNQQFHLKLQQQQQEQQNYLIQEEQEHQQKKPPSLMKTVIYEEECENELYEEQNRIEKEKNEAIYEHNMHQLVEEIENSVSGMKRNEEISEAIIVPASELMNSQPEIVESTAADKLQEFHSEIISNCESSHIQIVPLETEIINDLDLD
ncbi:unnamed protein product [Diamesa tonsa]